MIAKTPYRWILPATLIIALVALLGVLWFLSLPPAAAGSVACDVPSTVYPTIQSAVDDPNCDIVNVAAGSFAENVAIGRAVAIQGQGVENTTITHQTDAPIFTIDGNPAVRLRGLQLEGTLSSDSAIVIQSGDVTIHDTTIQNFRGLSEGMGIAVYAGEVTLYNTTLSNNETEDANGGGLYNLDGTVTIVASTFILNDNHFGYGAGLYNENGLVRILDSTFQDNITDFGGGGLYNANGEVIIRNSTFWNNDVYYDDWDGGGAILNDAGTVRIFNSTFSDNDLETIRNVGGLVRLTASTLYFRDNPDSAYGLYNELESGRLEVVNTIMASGANGAACGGAPVTSLGHNLATDATCNLTAPGDQPNTDPLLGPLQDNGGPTPTHALLPGSPAIDAADDAACPSLDQRGVGRPQDGDGDGDAICDIGAFELEPGP